MWMFTTVGLMTMLAREPWVARLIVRDSVALTPWEIAEGQALTPKPQDPTAAPAKDRALQDMLFQKQQRALAAYQEALKVKIPTKIHRELL